MRIVIQIVLLCAMLLLGYLVWDSINRPIVFKKEFEKRNTKVVNRLKDIRTAEVAFQKINGNYTANFDSLVDFVKTGKLPVVKAIGNVPDTLTEKKAIELGIVRRDTVWENVLTSEFGDNKNFNVDSLPFVPYGGGKKFELWSGSIETESGVVVPIFEAKTLFVDYLNDLEKQEVINLKLEKRRLGHFEGMKVGSRTEVNNNAGNWDKE